MSVVGIVDNGFSSDSTGYAIPNSAPDGVKRLELREQGLDERSQEYLSRFVKSGDTCLELGPGKGSMSLWLATQVGEQGNVDTIDIDPRFKAGESTNIHIIKGNIEHYDFPENHYDLIYARDVMIHLQGVSSEEMIKRLVQALRPGGYLVFEGVGDSADRLYHAFKERSLEVAALLRRIAERIRHRVDFSLPQKYIFQFRDAGLISLEGDRVEKVLFGGSRTYQMLAITFRNMKKQIIISGEEETFEELLGLLMDESFMSWSQGYYRTSGMKPGNPVHNTDEL